MSDALIMEKLEATARELVAGSKGILAADESTSTIEKRLRGVGVNPTEENRRAYRELLFTTPGLGEFISGVILFDETIRQSAADGSSFVEVLRGQGIVPGIKVDLGAKKLAGFPGETITEGLDGLRERLAEYAQLGARFTKWRAVIAIGPGIPTTEAIFANAHALARFASLSQEAGLVPIVEPEVLMDGDHAIERHEAATAAALQRVFPELIAQRVRLEAMLLKPNMVLAGKNCPRQASVDEAAEATLRCMRRHVPSAVPGLVFLSGGQSDVRATEHLNAMHRLGRAQCKSCKTVMIRNSKHVGPTGKGREEWFTVGSKHKCAECDGEITVVAGKTKDSMQHNCSKCGEGAVTCCAVHQ